MLSILSLRPLREGGLHYETASQSSLDLAPGCFFVNIPKPKMLRPKSKGPVVGVKYLQNLLSLPVELQISILLDLEVKDLLALRASSKGLNAMIEDCSPSIVRAYIKANMTNLEIGLYPAPAPGQAKFHYLLDVEHRIKVSRNLTALICDFYTTSMSLLYRFGSRRRRKEVASMYRGLFKSIQPLVFTLGHFFENYRRMILTRALKNCNSDRDFEISTGGSTLWEDQLFIMETYSPELVLDCYHVYGFLLQMLECELRPTKLQRAIRNLKGQNGEMCCTPEVEILLMLGGMEQVYRVLKGKSYGRRRDTLDSFIDGLNPTTNVNWRTQWQNLHVESGDISLDKIGNLRLRLPALHLVWVPCALKLLLCSKIINRVDFSIDSAARSPSDFIIDLLEQADRQYRGGGTLMGADDDNDNGDGDGSDRTDEEDDDDDDDDDASMNYDL